MRIAIHSTEPSKASPRVDSHAWTNDADFVNGSCRGVTMIPGYRCGIVISHTIGDLAYYDPYRKEMKSWAYSTWTSPVQVLAFGATRLVMSWNAQTPHGTWLRTEIQPTMQDGEHTPWLTMGNYSFFDTDIARTSLSQIAEPYGEVDTDTFLTYLGFTVRAYRLRVTLCRKPGTSISPRVWQLATLASAIPPREMVPESAPGPASREGIELSVPRYSQYVHDGRYTEYGGGGRSWCSCTSTEMVTEYWGMHPREEDLAWVSPEYQDAQVDFAARHSYDYRHQSTGNWAFNAAYASHFGLDAEIIQLPSMEHLEQLVAGGIPVVTAQSFDGGEITGASYQTAGHLWVVTGFTEDGDVIVNDPASPSNSQVRHVFNRRQFENVWLRTFWKRRSGPTGYSSGGVAYLIKPHEMKPPPNLDPAMPAWRE